MQCIICHRPSTVDIPGTTTPILICDHCLTYPSSIPSATIPLISRELGIDTFHYLLSQLRENKRLISMLTSQSETLIKVKEDTKHDQIPILHSQITDLTTQLTKKSQTITQLNSKILDLEAKLSESVTLESVQSTIMDNIPSLDVTENHLEAITSSIDILNINVNKILSTLTQPKPFELRKPTPSPPSSKTPDIPELDYEESE